MIEFRCPLCGTVLRAEEGDRVICVACGSTFYASASLCTDVQFLQQQDMPRWGEPVPQQQPPQQPYAQQPPQQPYAQQYPQQLYAQQYPQQPYAPQYPQQPYAQQYPQQPYSGQPYTQSYPPRSQVMPRQYTEEQLELAKKKRGAWHFMNAAMAAIQTVVLALGILWDDMDYDMGAPMIFGWLASVFVFAIASAVARPDDAYLEKKPAVGKAVQCLLQLLLGISTLFTGAILWGILSEFM